MKHLRDYAANLQIADQRRAEPTWSALRTPGAYVSSRKHTLEGFTERQHARMKAAGWAVPKEAVNA